MLQGARAGRALRADAAPAAARAGATAASTPLQYMDEHADRFQVLSADLLDASEAWGEIYASPPQGSTFLLPRDATFEAALGPNATLLLPAMLAAAGNVSDDLMRAIDDLLLSHVLEGHYPRVGGSTGACCCPVPLGCTLLPPPTAPARPPSPTHLCRPTCCSPALRAPPWATPRWHSQRATRAACCRSGDEGCAECAADPARLEDLQAASGADDVAIYELVSAGCGCPLLLARSN